MRQLEHDEFWRGLGIIRRWDGACNTAVMQVSTQEEYYCYLYLSDWAPVEVERMMERLGRLVPIGKTGKSGTDSKEDVTQWRTGGTMSLRNPLGLQTQPLDPKP